MITVKLSTFQLKSSPSTSVTCAKQAMTIITMASSTKVLQPAAATLSSSMTRKTSASVLCLAGKIERQEKR